MNEEYNSDLTFEQAIRQLEETVKGLESGELGLSESIERYKQAMSLVQFCRKELERAQLQIEQLSDDGSTIPIEEDEV
ncbi:exodeoxyribonuclease VII small subunit [Alicyclobacillaceae bacterium I2511]|nr:exodeoxyribonuclease VII small subunit [Alicyclobacillaceae bacterium I2511]